MWNRWTREYVRGLREQHRMTQPKSKQHPKIGEVVIVNDEQRPKNMWKLAIVKQLIRGRDTGAVIDLSRPYILLPIKVSMLDACLSVGTLFTSKNISSRSTYCSQPMFSEYSSILPMNETLKPTLGWAACPSQSIITAKSLSPIAMFVAHQHRKNTN